MTLALVDATSGVGAVARASIPFAEPEAGEKAALQLRGARLAVRRTWTGFHGERRAEIVISVSRSSDPAWRGYADLADERDRAKLAANLGDLAIELRDAWLLGMLERLEAHDAATSATALGADGLATPRFTFIDAPAMMARPEPAWLVRGVLTIDSMAALYGPPGSFKSFHVVDLALSIAAGRSWQGRPVLAGPTLYISGEGSGGLGKRIRAWEIARGTLAPTAAHFLPEVVNLLDNQAVDALLAAIGELAPPALIVVDTLARAMVGGDENSARDMGLAIDAAERLRQATGACVLLVHHTQKAGTALRGSSALEGALTTALAASADGALASLECSKQKDSEPFERIDLARRVVELGEDATGEPVSSLVFDPTTSRAQAATISASQARAERILGTFGAGGASASAWQRACLADGISKPTFYRVLDEAVRAGRVVAPSEKRGSYLLASGTVSQGLTRSHETE